MSRPRGGPPLRAPVAGHRALYGSFGALMALLLFTYAASLVVLFGAELASELPRLPPDPEPQERVRAGLGRLRRGRRGSTV